MRDELSQDRICEIADEALARIDQHYKKAISKIEIPKRLQDPTFQFILVDKKSKKPSEAGWPMYSFDHPRLLDHLTRGGNYGVRPGEGHLCILDADNPNRLQELGVISAFDGTFFVSNRTDGRGHYYFLCDKPPWKKMVLQDPEKTDEKGEHLHLGELFAGKGNYQVVGPGSIHPEGRRYEVRNDAPLREFTFEELEKLFAPFVRREIPAESARKYRLEKRSTITDRLALRVEDFLMPDNPVRQGEEIQGAHPVHGSDTGMNIRIDTRRGIWHCFRHKSGGDALMALAVREGIIRCEDAVPGALQDAQRMREIHKALLRRGLLKDEQDPGKPYKPAPVGDERADAARRIRINGVRTRDITDAAFSAVLATNSPPWVFVRGGSLTRIARDENKAPVVHTLDEAGVRFVMERAADFYTYKMMKVKDKEGTPKEIPVETPVAPSGVIVQDFMSHLEWPGIPPLVGITEAPTILPDGALLTDEGYNQECRLYYAPGDGFKLPPIPEHPTQEEIAESTSLLQDLFQEFPFDGYASRTNTLAALLTAVLRPLISGPVPLALFDKPQAGTGATLITRVIGAIATGREALLQGPPKNDEEWKKVILTILISGRPVVVFDNLEGKLYTPALAVLLTSITYADRLLGMNKEVSVPNRAVWLATGNNVQLGGDLPRRCYWIRMDAKAARPWQRTGFKHKLPEWALEERPRFLAAAFTLARAWIRAGRPEPVGVPLLGSYEEWRHVIGGVLEIAGVHGFLENLEQLYDQSDIDTQQWDAFIVTLKAEFPDTFTVAEVVRRIEAERYAEVVNKCVQCAGTGTIWGAECPLCKGTGLPIHDGDNVHFGDSLPDEVIEKKGNLQRLLGRALARKVDRIYPSGLVIRKAGVAHKVLQWTIEMVGG